MIPNLKMFSSVLVVTLRFKRLTLSHRAHFLLNLYSIVKIFLNNYPRYRFRAFPFLGCYLKTRLKVNDLNDCLIKKLDILRCV